MPEKKDKDKIQVVFGPDDQDLLRQLDEEVFRRKQAGDKSANRSSLIMERLKAASEALAPEKPAPRKRPASR